MRLNVHVLLSDRYPALRAGIRQALDADQRFLIIGESQDHADAVNCARTLRPEVLVIGVEESDFSVVEALGCLHTECPQIRIVVLAADPALIWARDLLRRGVAGFIRKSEPVETVITAIRTVAEGGLWFDAAAVQVAVRNTCSDSGLHAMSLLTEREKRVLSLLAKGKGNREIANELVVTQKTVEFHVTNILAKLCVHSRAEAIAWIYKNHVMRTRV